MALGSSPNSFKLIGDIFQLVEDIFCMYKVIGSNPIISIIFKYIKMHNKIKKNIKQRLMFSTSEQKRLILKSISNNLFFNNHIRWKSQIEYYKLNTISSITRIKNICIVTGRSRSVSRFFKLSRIQFKKYISLGLLPGTYKHSW